jgi:hypothetical protein
MIESLASKAVDIHLNVGNVKAAIQNFDDLRVEVTTGNVKLDLSPNETSSTTGKVGAGDIKWVVLEYSGEFDLSAKIGTVKVDGSTAITSSRSTWAGKAITGL